MANERVNFGDWLILSDPDQDHLAAEIRQSFIESANSLYDLLVRARCDANWHIAADRLIRLAQSFDAYALAYEARLARKGAPHDPIALKRLGMLIAEL